MMMTVMMEGRYGVKMEKSECRIHARKFVAGPKRGYKMFANLRKGIFGLYSQSKGRNIVQDTLKLEMKTRVNLQAR